MNDKSSGSQQNLVVYTTLSLSKNGLYNFFPLLQSYKSIVDLRKMAVIIIFFFQIFLSNSATMWKTWRQHPPSHWTELKENKNGALLCVCVCVCVLLWNCALTIVWLEISASTDVMMRDLLLLLLLLETARAIVLGSSHCWAPAASDPTVTLLPQKPERSSFCTRP